MTRQLAFLLLGMILFTSCSTTRPAAATGQRFNEENNADIVIRYYSDGVNRVLKPLQMEGPFLSTFDRGGVLAVAEQQSGRQLAVVILLRLNASNEVKQGWTKTLAGAGYKRIVFLRAEKNLKINGLRILENPSEITVQQRTQPEPNV